MTEAELIASCKKGQAKAQKMVYELHADTMLAVCCRYVKNELDAEEVMLNGFVKVFQCIPQFEQKGSFEGWIRRIMVNEALQFLRIKEPLHLTIERDHYQLTGTMTADAELDAEDLYEILHALPAGYRAVFNLYAIEGYSHKEIADMLQISEGTSKSQLSKARALLQKLLLQKNDYNQEICHERA